MVRKYRKILVSLVLVILVATAFPATAFAVTEDEVSTVVNSQGRDAVAGNLFVWVLCAISFLKISQKIDSFMSSLGINVGHTGGSMLGEAMVAARALNIGKSAGGSRGGGSGGSGGSGSSGGSGGPMQGGLIGVAGRQFRNGAATAATGMGSGGIGGKAFESSMSKGGSFANNVIGGIAKGNMAYDGSITGETATSALNSYMGFVGQSEAPQFSDVEIGGGRITGTETSTENPDGASFGMYYSEQYTAPSGDYSTVKAADGSKWYKQYAADHVERTPHKAPDGGVAYRESIVQKLPDPPKRKDRL